MLTQTLTASGNFMADAGSMLESDLIHSRPTSTRSKVKAALLAQSDSAAAMSSYACALCVWQESQDRAVFGADTPRTIMCKYRSARVGVRRVRGR